MGKLASSARTVRLSDGSGGPPPLADEFVRAFNDARLDLANTLAFVLGSQEDAQDTVQETFLKCWRTVATLGEVRCFRAWIFRVGLNAAKDLQRNAWRRRARHLGDAPPPETRESNSPVEIMEEKERLHQLRDALSRLRPDEQEVFLLRQKGELTFEEIAELRRLPVGTVKTQMRAALQKLKLALKDHESYHG